MNARRLVARTVILVLSDIESLKGTVDAESCKDTFVLERPVLLEAGPDGTTQETQIDGKVWVSADRPTWVQVI